MNLKGLTPYVALMFVAAPAQAAPLGELPFRTVPTAAVCVRATGLPGELVRWSQGGFTVMQARADGLHDVAAVKLGKIEQCPVIATDPSTGAAVVAATTKAGIRVVTRAPGGAWSAPQEIAAARYADLGVGVSAAGDAVVAWRDTDEEEEHTRIRVARSPQWQPESLTPLEDYDSDGTIAAGMSAAGEATVVFKLGPGNSGSAEVRVATAAPGAPFATRTVEKTRFGGDPALAVAPDGRTLVTVSPFNGLNVYERPPGGTFAAPQKVFDGAVEEVALVQRPDGGAVIAFNQGTGEPLRAFQRGGPGPFGPQQLARQPIPRRDSDYSVGYVITGGSVPVDFGPPVKVALGADGRALAAATTEASGFAVAAFPSGEQGLLASPLRDPLGITPVVLADGTLAVAWSDGVGQLRSGPQHGRLHFAVEGAASAPPAAQPAVKVKAPERRALRPAQDLVLPVTCNAACDLRASLPGRPPEEDAIATLTRPGTARLRFEAGGGSSLIPPGKRPLTVTVRSGPPGATTPRTATFDVRLKRLPAPPLPQIRNLRARRAGDDIVVRWDADFPARDAYYIVTGTRQRTRNDEERPVVGVPRSRGRHPRVRLQNAAHVRYVTVELIQFAGSSGRTQTIRVG